MAFLGWAVAGWEGVLVIAAGSGGLGLAVVGGGVVLVPVRMGGLTVYASAAVLPGVGGGEGFFVDGSVLDGSVLFARAPRVVDFSGFYVCGAVNPAFRKSPVGPVGPVVWGAEGNQFLAPGAGDWRPWPWLGGVDPVVLVVHAGESTVALVTGGGVEHFTVWAVGAWVRGEGRLGLGGRPLTDPVVWLCCAARVQEVADEVGRLVYGPDGGTVVGAQPLSVGDESAGVMVGVTLFPGGGGGAGRFGSAYPRGGAGDVVRWAYRERFKSGELGWMGERFAPSGAVPPQTVRPRVIKGGGRLFGWCYFDERDWRSRRGALSPVGVGSVFVVWAPNGGYRPGAARDLDPATGNIAADAEPWQVTGQGVLPFEVGNVAWAAVYFSEKRGCFVVADPATDLSYLESPRDFGARLRRDYLAAARAAAGRGAVLPRTVVLLADNDPVPARVVALVVQGLGDVVVITVSMPAVLFADDHPGGGVPVSRVALVPGSGGTTVPVWTATGRDGTTVLTAPVWPGSGPARGPLPGLPPVPVRVPVQAGQSELGGARPQDLVYVRAGLEAGTGLVPGVPVPVLSAAGAGVVAGVVRSPVSVNFCAGLGPGEWPLGSSWQLEGGWFEVAEVNAVYDPAALADAGGSGPWPPGAWPVLITGRGALPPGAARGPLYFFVDFCVGVFLLHVKAAGGGAAATYAETPAAFGRRIRAELTRAQAEHGAVAGRPVVLLARHRPVPAAAAAAVARQLPGTGGDLYTPSLPASVYVRGTGTGAELTLVLIRLPGHPGQPHWTRSTPLGQSEQINTPAVAVAKAEAARSVFGAPAGEGRDRYGDRRHGTGTEMAVPGSGGGFIDVDVFVRGPGGGTSARASLPGITAGALDLAHSSYSQHQGRQGTGKDTGTDT